MKLSVAIFDLDGTLVDSEDEWGNAYFNCLTSLGVKPISHQPQIPGVAPINNWKLFIEKYGIKTQKTLDELVALTYEEYKKQLSTITLKTDALNFLESLKNSEVQIALATSSSWDVVDKILQNLNIHGLFDAITTIEEVSNPKPDPEIFIATMDKLVGTPEECLVFEDSKSGVDAAKSAGMRVIAIDPSGEKNDLDAANIVIEGYSEITPKVIAEL